MLTTRTARDDTLDTRARLAIFHGSSIGAEEALGMDVAEVNFDILMRAGVRANNLITANQGPTALLARGVSTASQMRQLGLDSLHLCDADFCNGAMLAYGASAVASAFLVSAADAVNLAGMEAMHILRIDTRQLLECCVGFPGEAEEVLKQLPHGAALQGVPCVTVLDAGLRASALMRCGYGLNTVVSQLRPTGPELGKLGYSM
ncbi:MAG: hypothetical protein ACKVI4_14730 [Actinomycetales bacterium]